MAYSYLNNKKVLGFIPGKILDIDGYKILHQFNTKKLLSVSPICIIENKKFKVIGIQLENPDIYKYMSYGYLLVYILTKLNIIKANDYNISLNSFISIKDEERNIFLSEFRRCSNYSFYTFDQYKNAIYYLHNKLSKFYTNQTTQDFNNEYTLVKKPQYSDYIKKLELFHNINSNWYQIFNNDELLYNLNKILLTNDYNVIRDFSYFIAGIIFALRLTPKLYNITYDNKILETAATCLIIANAGNMYKNWFSVAKKCEVDDGLADVFILKAKNPVIFFLEFLLILFGIKKNNCRALYFKAKNINIQNNWTVCHIDGEKNTLKKEININILPEKIKMFCR